MAEKFLHILQKGISKLQRLIYYGFWVAPRFEKNVIAQFHEIYCYPDVLGGTWGNTYWLGVPVQKCIFDMWVYQEILFEVRPDIIIECGTANGGGTLFLSSVCDVIGSGNIVSVDIEDKKDRPQHKRIKYLLGSSTSKEIVEQVRQTVSGDCKVMVILDSDHHKEHVLNELRIYNELVTEGELI